MFLLIDNGHLMASVAADGQDPDS